MDDRRYLPASTDSRSSAVLAPPKKFRERDVNPSKIRESVVISTSNPKIAGREIDLPAPVRACQRADQGATRLGLGLARSLHCGQPFLASHSGEMRLDRMVRPESRLEGPPGHTIRTDKGNASKSSRAVEKLKKNKDRPPKGRPPTRNHAFHQPCGQKQARAARGETQPGGGGKLLHKGCDGLSAR